jgi:pyocin large subunit-like protein
VRPTDKLRWIRRVELCATDRTAAIFSNVSFTGTNLCLSPAEGELRVLSQDADTRILPWGANSHAVTK